MANDSSDQFVLVGDPGALPDAFFESLASLLWELEEAHERQQDAEEDAE